MKHSATVAAAFALVLLGGCANTMIESDPPGAKAYINGQYLGTTPFTHTFWAGQDASASAELVAPGHDRSELVYAPRPYGLTSVQIVTAPAGAECYIDGQYVGKSPMFTRVWFPSTMKGVWKKPAPAPSPRPQVLQSGVSCDLRVIRVSDGSAVAEASGTGSDLGELAKTLVGKLRQDFAKQGEAMAVGSLRDRAGTPASRAVTDELADKVAGALIATKWFDVKERIDLRATLLERDLDTADIIRNPKVKEQLAGISFIVIGGVTVAPR